MSEIAREIVDIQFNADKIDKTQSFRKKDNINGNVETNEVDQLRHLYGNLSNSQLLTLAYLDKMIALVHEHEKCHIDFKKSTEFLV